MRPITSLPELVVEIEGRRLLPGVAGVLGQVRVRQRLSLPALCELVFFDSPNDTDRAGPVKPGSRLTVRQTSVSASLFSGEITAMEEVYEAAQGRQLRVRGYDLLHRLRKRQPVRVHLNLTCLDLARELVADLALSVHAADAGPTWQRLIQYQQTDFDLLAEVAESCGLYFTLRDDVLHLLTLAGEGTPVALALGDSLLEARAEINTDTACESVSAVGWDPGRVEIHEARAVSARLGRQVDSAVSADMVGGTGERALVAETIRDNAQAEALAQAELDSRAGREITLWGVASGNPDLQPGTPILVEGISSRVTGRHVLTAVTHTVDARRGFISEFSTTPPPRRARLRGAAVGVGRVTRIDDPERLGRVQVTLPGFGGVEADWMEVLTTGAGAGKGLVMLPDVGDQVLVLFPSPSPTQGIVLGGLYGSTEPPDWGIEPEGIRRFTLRTPGGQRVQLDDQLQGVRLENSQGSYVQLSPKKVVLHAATALEIEAPGQSVVIRGDKIDFQKG